MKKKGSLNKNIMVSLIVLGLVILLGSGVAGGIQLYRQNLSIYRNMVDSYVNMLSYELLDAEIGTLIEKQDEMIDLYWKFQDYYASGDREKYKEIMEQTDEETVRVMEEWNRVSSFILGFGNLCADIRYAYVVIPTEEDLIYLWDSDLEAEGVPFTHDAYTEREKEHLLRVYNGELDEDFFIDRVDQELLGTSLSSVYDREGVIRAVAGVDISISEIHTAFLKLIFHVGIAITLIMLASIMAYHYVINRRILGPITTLTKAADNLVNDLREGNSGTFHADIRTNNEIEILAQSFEEMDSKLKDYIQENETIIAEKERIETELALAARIQEDMLPSVFPPFPDRTEVDLYAVMKPAKEVGGDFYDFFLIDEDHLGLVMADVSGKGVPAALFMMMSKIMLQNFALTGYSPKEVLSIVNSQMCRNTKEEMFVTVWLGVLELSTGLLRASNAGHEYPVLKKPDGAFELIKDPHGLVLGGMEESRYKEYQLQLEPGSRLFLYTDGLPEATRADGEMYGTGRMLQALNEVKTEKPKEVLEHMILSASGFSGDAPQFDDTTMLCLDYFGINGPGTDK